MLLPRVWKAQEEVLADNNIFSEEKEFFKGAVDNTHRAFLF